MNSRSQIDTMTFRRTRCNPDLQISGSSSWEGGLRTSMTKVWHIRRIRHLIGGHPIKGGPAAVVI